MIRRNNFLVSSINRYFPNIKGIYYVYCYFDPETFIPFYIGKGKNKRYLEHLRQVVKGRKPKGNKHKYYKIKQILDKGLEPIILILENFLSEEEAFIVENKYISLFKESLTNICTNGILGKGTDTISNNPNREEICSRLSRIRKERHLAEGKNNGMFGKGYLVSGDKHYMKKNPEKAKEAKRKLSENNYQKKMSKEELKAKCWNNRYDKDTLEKIYSKFRGENNPFYRKKIKEWEEITENIDIEVIKLFIKIAKENLNYKIDFLAKLFNLTLNQSKAIFRVYNLDLKRKSFPQSKISQISEIRRKYNINEILEKSGRKCPVFEV